MIFKTFDTQEIDRDYEDCSNIEQFVRDNSWGKTRPLFSAIEEIRARNIDERVFANQYIAAMVI